MITNFEQITAPLSPNEYIFFHQILTIISERNENNPITAQEILNIVNDSTEDNNIKCNSVTLRKVVNILRTHSISPIIATSKGYYITNSKKLIELQILSLQERANSILKCANGLQMLLMQLDTKE